MIATGLWDGGALSIAVGKLPLGVYNITIVVFDISMNWISDTVLVTVIDTLAPSINHPVDINLEAGINDCTITWVVSEIHPSHYVIYRNSSEVASDQWNGYSISIAADSLNVRIYNYTILVYDTSGKLVYFTTNLRT